MYSPVLSIVIPVRNKWELTRQCLVSLAATIESDDHEVILVDNASSDATPEAAMPTGQLLFGERFQVLRQDPPLPFAASCNAGARKASGDLLFLLNNDTKALPGWRPPLQGALESDASLGAAGPLLLYPDVFGFPDRVQHLGIEFSPDLNVGHLYEYFPAQHPVVQKKRRFQAITGAALLLRRKLFLALDGFHEAFINGFEDVDFCLRLGQSHLGMTVEASSRFYHLCSQTPGRGEHEKANAVLLGSRCRKLVNPDTHMFLRADGYRLQTSPWLRYEATPDAARLFRLSRLLVQPEEEALFQAIADEPFWTEGYVALAALLEARGNVHMALRVLLLGAQLKPVPPILLPLLRLVRSSAPEVADGISEKLRSLILEPEERARALRRMRGRMRGVDRDLAESAQESLNNLKHFLTSEYQPLVLALQQYNVI